MNPAKAKGIKSRVNLFLMAKNLTKSAKKTAEIYPSIQPDHNAICIPLSWVNETPRGPGYWKLKNIL